MCARGANRRLGFSLPEVLVVISILMILVGIVTPVILAAKGSAKDRVCIANLSQSYRACLLYITDFDDRFPSAKDCIDLLRTDLFPPSFRPRLKEMPLLPISLAAYAKNDHIFECPRDQGARVVESNFPESIDLHPNAFKKCGLSYEYHTALGAGSATATSIQHISGVNLLADLASHWHGSGSPLLPNQNFDDYLDAMHFGRWNVVYTDGHVKQISHSEYELSWRRD